MEMEMENHSVLSQLTGIVEMGNLLAWGSVVLAAIVAFSSLVRFAGIGNFIRRLLPANSGIPEPVLSYDEEDTWSSCTSSDVEDDGDEEFASDADDFGEVSSSSSSSSTVDEEWKWSNRSGLELSEIGGGRDVVVRSWEQQPHDIEEEVITDRRKQMGLGWDNPIVSAWGDGGQKLRKRHLGNTYSAVVVVDDGGSIEEAVMEWCRNAASYLPLLSPNTRSTK